MHLQSKFYHSATLFKTEATKLDYIRDYTDGIAFEVIKDKADPTSTNPYPHSNDTLAELERMFGEHNIRARMQAKLHDPSFAMNAQKETFEQFLVRFTTTIAPCAYSDEDKIFHLKRNLIKTMQTKVSDGTKYNSLDELITRYRGIDTDYNALSKDRTRRNNSSGNSSGSRNNRGSNSTSNRNSNRPRGVKYPAHVVNKISKEGRCFKCLEKGHRSNDPNAPCKDAQHLTQDQVTAKLATVGVQWEEPQPSELDAQGNE